MHQRTIKRSHDGITIGLDVGDRFTHICVLDPDGEVTQRTRVRTTRQGLTRALDRPLARVVLETGTHSPWISRLARKLGHDTIVAHARKLRSIIESDSKNDDADAEELARLARVDAKMINPVTHRNEQAQRDLAMLHARDTLVRMRTQLVNQIRGFAKSLGLRIGTCSTEHFPKAVREELGEDLFPGVDVMLAMLEKLTTDINRLTRQAERIATDRYPDTAVVRQIKGVGPVTALAFVLTIEEPSRFPRSRTVGAYLGLRPRQRDSGERKPQLGISKAGDSFVRRLLINCAHYIMGPFGPDTDLRSFGQRIADRGGKAAKKRAVTAVARKLAVLMHRLWMTGEVYEPIGYGRSA